MATKKYLHILFLVTVVILKISSAVLHMSVHHGDDDGEQCELCEHAIHNQDIDSDILVQSYNLELICSNFSEKENFYKSIHKKLSIHTTLFGRPPPSLV